MMYILQNQPTNPSLKYADSIEIGDEYDEIISVGGGSTIDVGKWIAKKYGLKHTAIPTTCGSGSEVTRFCVLMVDGKKKTFSDKAFIPHKYILKPELLKTLPKKFLVSSMLDALCHAFESYWSKKATRKSKKFSLAAMNLLVNCWEKAIEKNDNALMFALIAANMAGRAINITKTNVCHAISYPLTEMYDIPHGYACAISLSYFVKKFMKKDISFIKKYIPEYKIDKKKIAEVVIKSEKLKDLKSPIKKSDIIKAL